MYGNRSKELWLLIGITSACSIIGLLSGQLTGSLLAGLVIYTAWHLYHLAGLPAIISKQRQPGPGFTGGLWADVMQSLDLLERDNRLREQQLSLSLEHFRITVESLPDAVVMLQPDDIIEWSNSAAETLLGIPAATAGGQRLSASVRDPLLDEYLQAGDFSHPLTLSAPGYRPATLLLHVRSLEGNTPLRVIVARDISQQYNLNESQHDFIANISHELRTPLTVITGLLEQLEPEVTDSKTGRRITTLMQDQAQRMRELVADLLVLMRIATAHEDTQDELVPVEELLASIIEEARTLGKKSGHVLLTDIQSGYGLRGKAGELRSAFTNLVVNAIRHTPDRAEIRVSWRVDESGARFSVSDTGEGIPARHIPRLTERFYRVDSSRSRDTGGTGLGLSLVKQVLDRHDAALKIISAPGQGSTFTCHFPPTRAVSLAAAEK
ncbi:MAG: phosphate regulon sensor histidine kinase PhoR [Halobacteria archaeon]|nr:phosphate regulon sensor histidine kinase PhoR [Halobacteria archaeon]